MRGAIRTAALGAVLLAVTPPAAADGFRCGNELVSVGDTKVAVVKKCGDPLLRETVGLKKTADADILVERWTYDLGPGRFLQILTFEGGDLVAVEDDERR